MNGRSYKGSGQIMPVVISGYSKSQWRLLFLGYPRSSSFVIGENLSPSRFKNVPQIERELTIPQAAADSNHSIRAFQRSHSTKLLKHRLPNTSDRMFFILFLPQPPLICALRIPSCAIAIIISAAIIIVSAVSTFETMIGENYQHRVCKRSFCMRTMNERAAVEN